MKVALWGVEDSAPATPTGRHFALTPAARVGIIRPLFLVLIWSDGARG
ncbi:MAG: hypothetical protein L0228_19530 [Planctomycetes bacterium]|nr:hypothetical protein [Planctomycetota bacterium]